MNILPLARQLYAIQLLTDGCSIRTTSRLSKHHITTIMRLQHRAGLAAEALLADRIRRVKLKAIEIDELWSFVGKKQKHVRPGDPPGVGSQWVWLGMDKETKLCVANHVGPRSPEEAEVFLRKLKQRIWWRPYVQPKPHHFIPELHSDGWVPYPQVVWRVFGTSVKHGVVVKASHREPHERERMLAIERYWVRTGEVDESISTSYIERFNGTMRGACKRLARKTLAYSKRADYLASAISLQAAYFNFVWVHRSLGTTPAVAAGVADCPWSLEEFVEELAGQESFGFRAAA